MVRIAVGMCAAFFFVLHHAAAEEPRVDAEGVPLPAGVLMRLGSSRMRHGPSVTAVAITADGRVIASVGTKGSVKTWDGLSGRQLGETQFSCTKVALTFRPDGQELVCVTDERTPTIHVLESATARELRKVELSELPAVDRLVLSSSGSLAAIGSNSDKTVRIFNAASGELRCRYRFSGSQIVDVDFSKDDRRAAVGSLDAAFAVIDSTTGQLAYELNEPGLRMQRVALSPNGDTAASLATVSGAGTELQIWDLKTKTLKHRIPRVTGLFPVAFGFTADGQQVLTGNPLGHCVLWRVSDGKESRRLIGHWSGTASAFSEDGKTLVVGGTNGAVTLWNAESGKLLAASANPTVAVNRLRFSADGKQVIGMCARPVAWDLATGKEIPRFAEMPIAASILDLSPDERTVVCGPWGSQQHNIRLFEGSSGKEIRIVGKDQKPWFLAPAFSRDGRVLVCPDYDRSVYAFDVQSGEELFNVGGFGSRVTHIAVSPDNHWVAAAGDVGSSSTDFAIRLLDMTTGKEHIRMDPGRPSRALKFSENARLLVAVSRPSEIEDRRAWIHIWDIASGRQFRVMEVDTTSCDTVAITRNNAMIAFGGGDGSVRIHEIASGAERVRFTGPRNAIGSVTISPDGRLVAAASADAPVFVWDIFSQAGRSQQPSAAAELDQAWTSLAGADAKAAYQAICRFVAAPEASIAFLRDHLKPATPADPAKVREWIKQLESPTVADREKAAKELEKWSDQAEAELSAALNATQSFPVRSILVRLLNRLGLPTDDLLRGTRCVEILECIATPAARELLKALAGGAPGAHLTEAAAAASKRLER